jgi:hypothetical protein
MEILQSPILRGATTDDNGQQNITKCFLTHYGPKFAILGIAYVLKAIEICASLMRIISLA